MNINTKNRKAVQVGKWVTSLQNALDQENEVQARKINLIIKQALRNTNCFMDAPQQLDRFSQLAEQASDQLENGLLERVKVAAQLIHTRVKQYLVIETKNGEVTVSPNLLSDNSPFFRTMLENKMVEQQTGKIDLKNFSIESILCLINILNAPSNKKALPENNPKVILELIQLVGDYEFLELWEQLEPLLTNFVHKNFVVSLKSIEKWVGYLDPIAKDETHRLHNFAYKAISIITRKILNKFKIPYKGPN